MASVGERIRAFELSSSTILLARGVFELFFWMDGGIRGSGNSGFDFSGVCWDFTVGLQQVFTRSCLGLGHIAQMSFPGG